MTDPNSPFTADQQALLATLVEAIIPASPEFCVPGASDPEIFVGILEAAEPHSENLAQALAIFGVLQIASAETAPEAFRAKCPTEAQLLQTFTAQCYYRDPRVMKSLGMEPRPPFPLGFEIEQGDWSLLDPVRARPELYRRTD